VEREGEFRGTEDARLGPPADPTEDAKYAARVLEDAKWNRDKGFTLTKLQQAALDQEARRERGLSEPAGAGEATPEAGSEG
jgi:hypothetical protein